MISWRYRNFATISSSSPTTTYDFRVRVCSVPRRRRRRRGRVMAPLHSMKLEGISDELKKIIDANMDEAPARRRAREAFKEIQLGIDHCLFKIPHEGLKMKESYEVNSRGLEIFSKSWLPETSSPKALICLCHGYGDTCTFFFEGIARKLALSGYSVFAMDYPGFGLSEGFHGYIPSFDRLVDDVIEHFSKVKGSVEYQSLPSFIFGESMGGAVALKVHLKQPSAWDGALLVAPMCKIADDMVPPLVLKQLLLGLAKFAPKSKLVPSNDIADMAFRDLTKRKQTSYNIVAYKDKPRLGTAAELLKITDEIEKRLEEVSLPLLIMHGEADVVTDVSVSKALYEKARSSDKKLHLYKDAYHALLEGEPDEMIEGLSPELNSIASQNLDFAPARRYVRSAFTDIQQQLDHLLFKAAPSGIRTEEWYEKNSKAQQIFCKSWLPKRGDQVKGIAKRIAASGYGVYAVDHPGFGLSEEKPEVRGLPCFLLGQSMGGAVAIKVHLKRPKDWDGVILVAPMCKISDVATPPPVVLKVLTLVSKVLPKAKLIPKLDLGELAFRESDKRKLAVYNVISYSDQTRLRTGLELLKATQDIEAQVERVSSPLLVLHGAADKVTDPLVSKFLYEKASSKDKTLKLYPDGYHCILEGEPDERIITVLDDIVSWLDFRCSVK
ncbi:hypothetical protein GIB67_012658 [Kingdonia uniflora]|uniref:Serine aminopeptidase S33 domain-containing protein n=1 Tax=Kingdonia uniflora TaxID=39325 RepID=A0A7J7NEV7_9MAGN|nr:hypothetical protein GIB67_012658 [Kingdonia uniflora]